MENNKITPIEVQKFLGGVSYPATKQELVQYASDKGADEEIVNLLDTLPERDYDSPADVSKAVSSMAK